jgi:hypothetical protein
VNWVLDTFRLYGRVFGRGGRLLARNWWLAFVAAAFQALFVLLAVAVAPLGIIGGVVVTVAIAAFLSSWFVLMGQVVRYERATPKDVLGSFTTYLGDWLTFGFLLWALQYVAGIALAELSYLTIVFELALLVFLSAVPEEIYLAHEAGTAVFVESYRFVGTNWIEWLPANGVLLVVAAVPGVVPVPGIAVVLTGLAAAFACIVRGLLFLELTTSSRRAREFHRRAAG